MKAVFVFSHPVLFRAWDAACERLEAEGIRAVIASQMSAVDWEQLIDQELSGADSLFLELSRHFPSFEPLVRAAADVPFVVVSGIETLSELPENDPVVRETVERYLKAGSVEDLGNAARFLLYRAGRLSEAPPAPGSLVLCAVADMASHRMFESAEAYFTFLAGKSSRLLDRPVAVLCFGRSLWLDDDLDLPRAAARELQRRDFCLVCVFCDWELGALFGRLPDHPLGRILDACGQRLACIWNGLISHTGADPGSSSPFEKYGVPVLQLLRNYAEDASRWRAGTEGLSAMSICYGMTQPEMLGCVEPTLVACNRVRKTTRIQGTVNEADVVLERIERLAGRSERWYRLRGKPATEKRIAILLHSSPCKSVEATLATAAGLDAAESAVRLLRRLAERGYRVQGIPDSGADLIDLFLKRKAIHEFRWTSVEEIVSKHGVLAAIDRERYREDFDRLEPGAQQAVLKAWGDFPGESMVHRDAVEGDSLLVTGLEFGNALVLIEPKRGCYGPRCDGEVCRILHEPDIPPPHQFLATYFYLQREVDALVVMGAESPVEYLPGKRAGLSGSCFPEIVLGDLPVVYPYLVTATAEGLMAKRRGRAVLVDHLPPPTIEMGEVSGRFDEIEELYRQYRAAEQVKDRGRLATVAGQLRASLERSNLLAPDADEPAFALALQSLLRRLDAMRRRTGQLEPHVLGAVPSPEQTERFVREVARSGVEQWDRGTFLQSLRATGDEMQGCLAALEGRFMAPGPSGHLSRGKTEIAPTGRNFYGLDLKCIPTRAAFQVGEQLGAQLLRRYLQDEGRFPEHIGIVLWSSDAFRAEGELIGQILWLLGCAPRWKTGGRVDGIEVLPAEQLLLQDESGVSIARPRIDVVVQMSGVVRDTLPMLYQLVDDAVGLVAELQESETVNYVRAHVERRAQELMQSMGDGDAARLRRLASLRLFSSRPGSYGVGVNLALDASAWNDDADLAEVFINWTGTGYGKGVPQNEQDFAAASMQQYAALLKTVDIAYQKAAAPEYDALSIGCYSGFQGGMAAARRGLGGGETRLYWGDSVSGSAPEVRDLSEEIDLCFSAKLLNPDWIELQKAQGYRGATEISTMVNTAFAWSATSRVVTREQFDGICRVYVENQENRDWLARENPWALEEITRRLLEASRRELWQADAERLLALEQTVLSTEGDLEEGMGPVTGEQQGGSVDIFTREKVAAWDWGYRMK